MHISEIIYRRFGGIILRCIYLKLYKILMKLVIKYGSDMRTWDDRDKLKKKNNQKQELQNQYLSMYN